MKKEISASVMCADLTDLKSAIKELEKAKIEYIHIDIMDGTFVPNITLGFDLVNAIKKVTSIPLDVHMMVKEPGRFINRMNSLDNSDYIVVHYEADANIGDTLRKIREQGCKSGLAINPDTPVDAVRDIINLADMLLVMTVYPGFAGQKIVPNAEEKVEAAARILNELDLNIPIQVDGNMSLENGKKLCARGADIFVLGTSALFLKDKSISEAAEDFRAVLI